MKNTKLIFMGMLAVLLAFGLVFTSCEGPTGPAGIPGGAGVPGAPGAPGEVGSAGEGLNIKADLETYGFSIGFPTHTEIGRPAKYSAAIYSSIDYFDDATIGSNQPTAVGVTGDVILTVGDKSVKFTLTNATRAAIETAFKTALSTQNGFNAQTVVQIVDDPREATPTTKKVLKIANPGALVVESSLVNYLFGAGIGYTLDSSVSVTVDASVESRPDIWTIDVLTNGQNDVTGVSAKVTLKGRTAEIPVLTPVGNISAKLITALTGDDPVFKGYSITARGLEIEAAADTGGSSLTPDSLGYRETITFTDAYATAPTAITAADLVATLEGFTGDYAEYGYKVRIVPKPFVPVGAGGGSAAQNGKPGYIVGNGSTANAGGVAFTTSTNVIRIKAGDKWATTYLPLTAFVVNNTGHIHLGTTGFGLSLAGANLRLEAPAVTPGDSGKLGYTVEGTGAINLIFGTKWNEGTDYSPATDTPIAQQWIITVLGGGGVNSDQPTVASKIQLNPGTAAAAKYGPVIVATGDSADDIAGKIASAWISGNYTGGSSAIGNVITLTAPAASSIAATLQSFPEPTPSKL